MKKVLLLVTGVLIVAVGGYAGASKVWGFPLFAVTKGQESMEVAEIPSLTVSMGQFKTNLAETGRYIKITVEIQVFADKAPEFTERLSELKTDLYGLLRSKTYQGLVGEDGLRQLQAEILERIEERCPAVAKNVFFSEFIVQ